MKKNYEPFKKFSVENEKPEPGSVINIFKSFTIELAAEPTAVVKEKRKEE